MFRCTVQCCSAHNDRSHILDKVRFREIMPEGLANFLTNVIANIMINEAGLLCTH